MIQSVFSRPDDFLVRMGGEEFLIVMPDFKTEHAVKQAEVALARIRNDAVIVDDKEIRFTISIGIAQRITGERLEAWLKRVDKALYQSKNGGRDRLTVAPNISLTEDVA
jgi:diguanylate cyclase